MRLIAEIVGYLVLLTIFATGVWWLFSKGATSVADKLADHEDE